MKTHVLRFASLFLLGFASLSASAGGLMTIDGTLKSFDDSVIEIKAKENIYTIDRRQLTKDQDKKIKILRSTQHVSLRVPMTAVKSAKRIE